MFEPRTVDEQRRAFADDPLRVVILGAGVAGIVLAQLLRRSGLHPVLVDRRAESAAPGYMLALLPGIDAVLDDLGVHAAYRDASAPIEYYAARSHRGRLLRRDAFGPLLGVTGEYRGIERGRLLEVLAGGGCPITFGASATAVRRDAASGARCVDLADRAGTPLGSVECDLVVIAEGMSSTTRDLLPFGRLEEFDTRWSGWVSWTDEPDEPLIEELWGAGWFLGVYTVRGRLGVILGGGPGATADGPAALAARARREAPEHGARLRAALASIEAAGSPYRWRFDDVRSEHWTAPGAALLGDAAAGFLPTAGIGAGMAAESAWVLGRLLAGARPDTLAATLRAWETAERPRVESAQSNSRLLARLVFRDSRIVAVAREALLRALSVRAVLGPIARLSADQPDPAAILRDLRADGPSGSTALRPPRGRA